MKTYLSVKKGLLLKESKQFEKWKKRGFLELNNEDYNRETALFPIMPAIEKACN